MFGNSKKDKQVSENALINQSENAKEEKSTLTSNKKDLKDLIAPSGIDATNINHLEIISSIKRYARCHYISGVPRMATFPNFLRGMYNFGDINTSVFINPVNEADSQNDLNKIIVSLESERLFAQKRGDINRERLVDDMRIETERIRDEIAAGFNKLFEASVICTLFAYDLDELDKMSELLTMEMSKGLINLKSAWASQEDAFKSNLPFNRNYIDNKKHTFDRSSMATVFPFVSSEVGHPTGVPIGFDKQTGLPVLYNNFHSSLTNYNMVVFGKSGAGKSVTIKTITARSSVLMGIESLALDAEGEYGVVAESLGGINVVISPSSKTIINFFDVEPEVVRDEITGKDRTVLNIENKVEDVTNALLTMARGSTRSEDVNEITKQIIAEAVAEEYQAAGINSNPNSLYDDDRVELGNKLTRSKKLMPTIGSWYNRILQKASMNENIDYQFHFSYLTKVMRQYVREYDGQMAYFDGQSTFDLLDSCPFINLDISQLEERFARPLAQQILLSWVWEKYVKKNSEDRTKARQKRVLVDEAWMLLPYPEAVDFLNTMARRARKRNVSLAVISQKFQDFYENKAAQVVLQSSDTKLFLAQDKSEIEYIKEVFKLSDGEASYLLTCTRGEGLLKVGNETAIIEIRPTEREFSFIETNVNKLAEQRGR
ncbi:MAG: DUF87 domain-containing protein [Clostridia bacterium]|nr:DUF87 domain-containing protein [Clostridia bacterium]